MTNDEKLKLVKAMVGENDSDDVLSAYLSLAAEKILRRAYPYDEYVRTVPDKYTNLQCEIAAYLLNKRGAEGQIGHTENGINRQYENADVPASMLREITPVVGVIGG